MVAVPLITAILEAIKEGSKAYSTWQLSKEKRLLELCKDAAEKYIQVNEGDGEYSSIKEEEKKKLLIHFRKRFFAYN